MTAFVAIYTGNTIGQSEMIDVTAQPEIVNFVARRLLHGIQETNVQLDPIATAMAVGRRRALEMIVSGTEAGK